jgi:hypothetical protein
MSTTSLVRAFRPIDELESHLIDSFRESTQAEHRFLVLLREFDFRRGWEAYGNHDCAEWLNWRCGISRTTAQEKVRVARALWTLPKIDAAFREGALSYSKVRALTRVASDVTEADLLDYALRCSAAQCEDYCRRLRNGDPAAAAADARLLHEGRSLLPEDPSRSLFAKAADALVEMARQVLAGDNGDASGATASSSAEGRQVVVHVDAAALSGAGGESDLPLPTVRRLCCGGAVVPVIEKQGRPLDVGRRQRIVPTAMQRALVARDRGCTFPGCHHQRFLEAHHVHHWADGGDTRLDNLLLLCSADHTLIHDGGFSVLRRPDGSCCFLRPDGRPVGPWDARSPTIADSV